MAVDRRKLIGKQILFTIGIMLLGVVLGTFSKYLDYHQAQLPYLLGVIDRRLNVHNFLGGFAPWIFIAVCISIYSSTPVRAAINVFTFFVGMIACYYLYSNYVAGFFPRSYAMIWVGFTIASPFWAFICWHAKGEGMLAVVISAGIISVFFNLAFAYGLVYFDIRSVLQVMTLVLVVIVLHKSRKKTLIMIGMAVVIAVLSEIILPFRLW